MKKLIAFVLVCVMAFACAGGKLNITDSTTHQAIAYGSGKAMGIGVNKVVPDADKELSDNWVTFMKENQSGIVPGMNVMMLYNQSFAIVTQYANDPYGLIGDLGAVLTMFGGEYDQEGNLIRVGDVPRIVLMQFEMGYRNGRRVAESN